jgi:hypothetical protein
LSDSNSDQFTVETFFRPNSVAAGTRSLVGQYKSTGSQLAWALRQSANAVTFSMSTSGSGATTTLSYTVSGDALVAGTWYHVAVDKDATGKVRLYLDGVMKASSTPANSNIFNSTAVLTIGADDGGSNAYNGWLDEIRITKGVARYGSDTSFTPPTAAFPRS